MVPVIAMAIMRTGNRLAVLLGRQHLLVCHCGDAVVGQHHLVKPVASEEVFRLIATAPASTSRAGKAVEQQSP
jgi:hypothetical protein